jgi:glycosyltransferase involved in cell wall biosynthesis
LALKRFFKEEFDVINYNNISLMGGPKIYQYGTGIKLATLHDYWLLCPLSTLFKKGREICYEKDCIRCSLKMRKAPQLWRYTSLLRNSLKHIDALISPSNFLKKLHEEKGISKPIFRVPYLVNTIYSEENDTGCSVFSEPYFLFAGRLEVNKGVQKLIPAFKKGKHGRLLVAGDGSYRKELERMAEGSPYVTFLGYLGQARLMPYYRSALAVIVPSVWYDNYPMVILDAMRLGVPIIAHDIAGPGEMVRDSGAGVYYKTQEGLEACLTQIRMAPEMRGELAKRGKAYYEENFTEGVHLKRFFSVIEAVSAQKQNEKCTFYRLADRIRGRGISKFTDAI